jgi:hypothetical protein
LSLLLALQPAAPDPRLACAPRINMTARGNPPPLVSAHRQEFGSPSVVDLSVHLCARDSYRVERRMTRGSDQVGEVEWVPVSDCPGLRDWIGAAGRLSLPAPLLRPHRNPAAGTGGASRFSLSTHFTAGAGAISSMELQILEPGGVGPNALSQWFRDGEQHFKTCRDQGRGGTGYAPMRRPGR